MAITDEIIEASQAIKTKAFEDRTKREGVRGWVIAEITVKNECEERWKSGNEL